MSDSDHDPPVRYSRVDFACTVAGLLLFLGDIVLDVWAVVSFYREESYVYLGVLLVFLVGSSVLGQVFSWLWYRYDSYQTHTAVEGCLSPVSLGSLHVFQMGVYLRYAGVMEVAVRGFWRPKESDPGVAVSLSHDLRMLRLMENFTESAPQLVLMLTVMLRDEVEPFTLFKAAGSASAIACGVTLYHRSLRSFLPDKEQQTGPSSMVYFLWNLLLIAARVAALSLFASVLPCFVFTHFLCSWMVLVLFAARSQTDFMESAGGEWLYRATVGLIWYFCWFNVASGRTRFRSTLYHVWMLLDLALLCGLWCWRTYVTLHHYALVVSFAIIGVYGVGLAFKVVYYRLYHPKIDKEVSLLVYPEPCRRSGRLVETDLMETDSAEYEIDYVEGSEERSMPGPPERVQKQTNKRMRKLAENFYS